VVVVVYGLIFCHALFWFCGPAGGIDSFSLGDSASELRNLLDSYLERSCYGFNRSF
jgi:hypothetical protein